MGELTDRLERLVVEASSPDDMIKVTAQGRYEIRVQFQRGAYYGYTDREIARQLAAVASLVWARYRREYTEIVAAFRDDPDAAGEDEPRDRVFQERLEQMTVTGASESGRISLRSRALVRWEVTIADGTVRSLSQQEFLAELSTALAAVFDDYRAQLIILTDEIYDIGVPDSFRRAVAGRK